MHHLLIEVGQATQGVIGGGGGGRRCSRVHTQRARCARQVVAGHARLLLGRSSCGDSHQPRILRHGLL